MDDNMDSTNNAGLDKPGILAGREGAVEFFADCNLEDELQIIGTKTLETKIHTLAEKEIRLFWTIKSLKSYIDCERVPRGLRVFKEISQFQHDISFQEEWEKIHLQCSHSLLLLVTAQNEKEYSILCEELEKSKTELSTWLTETQNKNFVNKLERKLTLLQIEIKQQKKEKFLRDKNDFDMVLGLAERTK